MVMLHASLRGLLKGQSPFPFCTSGRPDAFFQFLGHLLSFHEDFFELLLRLTPPPCEDLGRRTQKLLWCWKDVSNLHAECRDRLFFFPAIAANSRSFHSALNCEPLTFYVVSSTVTPFLPEIQSVILSVGLSQKGRTCIQWHGNVTNIIQNINNPELNHLHIFNTALPNYFCLLTFFSLWFFLDIH